MSPRFRLMAEDTVPRSDHEATGQFSEAAIKDLISSSLKDIIKPTNEGESEGKVCPHRSL